MTRHSRLKRRATRIMEQRSALRRQADDANIRRSKRLRMSSCVSDEERGSTDDGEPIVVSDDTDGSCLIIGEREEADGSDSDCVVTGRGQGQPKSNPLAGPRSAISAHKPGSMLTGEDMKTVSSCGWLNDVHMLEFMTILYQQLQTFAEPRSTTEQV